MLDAVRVGFCVGGQSGLRFLGHKKSPHGLGLFRRFHHNNLLRISSIS